MNRVSRITLVGVVLEVIATLCDFETVLRDDLVQSVGAAGEDLAGVAVAQDVGGGVLVEGGGPFGGAAVAGSVVGGHCDVCGWVWLVRIGGGGEGLVDGEERRGGCKREIRGALLYPKVKAI
jgi:hypothetical protein